MIVKPVTEIGVHRPACTHKVRVAGKPTNASKIAAYAREKKGIPVDQCGARSDFLVDGAPVCRTHAGALALNHIIGGSK